MKKYYLLIILMGLFAGCGQNTNNTDTTNTTKTDETALQTASILSVSAHSSVVSTTQEEIWLESLITETPQEGRALAIKMARKTIGAIQSDPEVKKRLRKQYAEDPEQLILSAQVVAIEFKTVAEANNYWRK